MEDGEDPSTSAEISDCRKRKLEYEEELWKETSAKCPRESQESSVGEADETDKYKELHHAIKEGDLESVKCLVQNDENEKQFCYEEISALYKAFLLEQHEIIAYLKYKNAKLIGSEVDYVCNLNLDWNRLNCLLLEYNRSSEKSCVYRLISWSKSPQGLEGKHHNAVMSLYEDLFKSETIKPLMNIVEREWFDIIYDFESETVECIYQPEGNGEILGLTLSTSKEIFIGAKNLLSGDPRKRAEVYGVVAEELCHLALTALFENNAKPYREEDSELYEKFWDIMYAVKSLTERSCHIESVVKHVFVNYGRKDWESELIARVPHVIGIHGEEFGRQILQESPELCRLLSFYDRNVLPKCKVHTDPSLNTKSHRMIEQLRKRTDFVSFEEKRMQPLKENFPSFREYLVDEEGVSIVTTNCSKLCTLHIYHELKRKYGDWVEKRCLFFSSDCFKTKSNEIVDELKSKVWKHLIVVVDEKELTLQELTYEFLDHFESVKNEDLEIIIVTSSQYLSWKFESMAVNYKWSDLSDEYKRLRTHTMEYIFKGCSKCIDVRMEDVPELFSEADIVKIMSGELIEVAGGAEVDCEGYNSETYIERKFKAMTVDRNILENLPPETCIFIDGLSQLEELAIDEKQVQWLQGANDVIKEGKTIFISKEKRNVTFEVFSRKTPSKSNICLYYDNKVFYQRKLHWVDNNFKEHKRQKEITEEEMIDLLESNKVLIITELAGYGKSTVTSSIIKKVKKNISDSWVFRVNLNAFSTNCINDSCDEGLHAVLGLKNYVDIYHFSRCDRRRCFIFLDGFDEIPRKCKSRAMNLISYISGKNRVNMVITTREYLVDELEEKLNCFSLQLVSFSKENQWKYLDKLWKWKLKFPIGEHVKDKKAVLHKIKNISENASSDFKYLLRGLREINHENSLNLLRSEIDKLDFTKLAKKILNKTSLDRKRSVFMRIPLHLYMTGIIFLNSNFNLKLQSDIYCLYLNFIKQKFEIFLKEKLQLRLNGSHVMDFIMEEVRKKVFGIHFELANQLMQEGKVDLEMNELEKELCLGLGIVSLDGKQIQFLHQTFAEFFFAVSITESTDQWLFEDVLFEQKYNAIRKFLSSALEKKSFKNLTLITFRDVNFLVILMERIIDDELYRKCKSAHISLHTFKIMRKLLENLEAIDVKKEFTNRFLKRLNILIMDKLGKVDSNFMYPMRFGSCLTVEMIRNLIGRNFMVNSIIILNFVRYSENLEKVMNVLKKCLSMKCGGEFGSLLGEMESEGSDTEVSSDSRSTLGEMESEGSDTEVSSDSRSTLGETESEGSDTKSLRDYGSVLGEMESEGRDTKSLRDYRSVLGEMESEGRDTKSLQDSRSVLEEMEYFPHLAELLRIEDSDGKGLLFHALWNGRGVTFAKLLKFPRDILGKEQFLKVIVESDEYRKKMKEFIKKASLDEICAAFEGLHSIFGTEMENLFDEESKSNIIHKSVGKGSIDDFNNSFKNVKSLFVKCFGSERMKELLLSKHCNSNFFIHILFNKCSNKTLKEYLNHIDTVLEDRSKMQQFLKRKNRDLRNMFHLAVVKDKNLENLIKLCSPWLGKDDIKQMILSVDKFDKNVINLADYKNSTKTSVKNLKTLREYLM